MEQTALRSPPRCPWHVGGDAPVARCLATGGLDGSTAAAELAAGAESTGPVVACAVGSSELVDVVDGGVRPTIAATLSTMRIVALINAIPRSNRAIPRRPRCAGGPGSGASGSRPASRVVGRSSRGSSSSMRNMTSRARLVMTGWAGLVVGWRGRAVVDSERSSPHRRTFGPAGPPPVFLTVTGSLRCST